MTKNKKKTTHKEPHKTSPSQEPRQTRSRSRVLPKTATYPSVSPKKITQKKTPKHRKASRSKSPLKSAFANPENINPSEKLEISSKDNTYKKETEPNLEMSQRNPVGSEKQDTSSKVTGPAKESYESEPVGSSSRDNKMNVEQGKSPKTGQITQSKHQKQVVGDESLMDTFKEQEGHWPKSQGLKPQGDKFSFFRDYLDTAHQKQQPKQPQSKESEIRQKNP